MAPFYTYSDFCSYERAKAVAIDLVITSQLEEGSDIHMRWTEPVGEKIA